MQTFLPVDSFKESAIVLDNQRLGNQRCEAKVILKTLLGESAGWRHHPAVRMWRGYEHALCRYAIVICEVWRARGFNDEQLEYFEQKLETVSRGGDPFWFGDSRLHSSHRSNLLRKNLEHYSKFGWKESPDLSYWWPTKEAA